jgi:tetratricopeptide (TPR) repeat protein
MLHRVHRLVMRVIRDGLVLRGRLAVVCRDAAAVLTAYIAPSQGSYDLPAVRDIPEQVAALRKTVASSGDADDELMRELVLLQVYAMNFLGVGRFISNARQAISVGESLTADLERIVGPDDNYTLDSRDFLAAAYLASGRAPEAIQLYERTLADQERLHGPDNYQTLDSRDFLAAAYLASGRAPEAIQLHERTLADQERLHGPDNYQTLDSRDNLAAAHLAAGRRRKLRRPRRGHANR